MSKNAFPKNCDELFRKDFVHDKLCQFNISRGQDRPVIKQSLALDNNAELVGSFVNSLQYRKQNVSLTIGTDGQVSIQGSSPIAHPPGAMVNTFLKYKPFGPNKGMTDLSGELVLKKVPLLCKGKVNVVQQSWNVHSSVDAKVKQENVYVATDVSGKFGKDALTTVKPSMTVAVKRPIQGYPVCFGGKIAHHGKTPFGKVTLFSLAKSADAEIGCEYSYIRADESREFTVGAQWTLDKEAGSSLKFKVDNVGKLSAAYTQKISNVASITLGGQFDAISKLKNTDKDESTKFGIRLNLIA